MSEKHPSTSEYFARILSGNATEDEQKYFQDWLDQSEENKKQFVAYQKIWQSAIPNKRYNIQVAKLKTELRISEKLNAKKGILFYWQRVAAVLILPILIFAVYSNWPYHEISSSNLQTVKTPYGARTSFELPDGSVVWLNSGSEISFPQEFDYAREISLNGEAYLEVKKSHRPFIVKTYQGEVEVLGTKFDVCAYYNEPFQTTLVEGKVSVTDIIFDRKTILDPGYQYTTEDNEPKVHEVALELYTSWKDGKMIFKREPFEAVAKRLERWFNVTIELRGESIRDLWYTGTIEMESFTEVLELIKSTTPIEYSFNTKTRILTIGNKN